MKFSAFKKNTNQTHVSLHKDITNEEIGILLFLIAFLFGVFFRFNPALTLDFPINDGGLFYSAIETIRGDLASLPAFIEYNNLSIPFVYPPLAFYLGAWVGELFEISTITLLLWIPAIFLAINLLCFFNLVYTISESKLIAGMATFIFAFIPRSLTWLIMGGGLTRSIGFVFLVLAISQIYLLFRKNNSKYLLGSIFFSVCVCLSHPEAALHTFAYAVVIWFFWGRSIQGVKNAGIVILAVIFLTSPWWYFVLSIHGFDPFFAASKTGFFDPLSSLFILFPNSEEPFITFIDVLAIWGIFIFLKKRMFFLPALYVIPFLIEPRNAPNVIVVVTAILAAYSLIDDLFPIFGSNKEQKHILSSTLQKVFLGYLALSFIFNLMFFQFNLKQERVSTDARIMFNWIKTNTPPQSKFLIITGNQEPFTDYINEWFPVLAERRSETTIQGYEWIQEVDFTSKDMEISDFQICAHNSNSDICIETTSEKYKVDYDFILTNIAGDYINSTSYYLIQNKNYKKIYETEEFIIFEYLLNK